MVATWLVYPTSWLRLDKRYGNAKLGSQSNAGVVLQALSEHALSLRILLLAQSTIAKSFGATHVQNAQALHQLTQAHFLSGDIPSALATSEEAHRIFVSRLGQDHSQTREVGRNIDLLRAVLENVKRQKIARDKDMERTRAIAGSNRRRLGSGLGSGSRWILNMDGTGSKSDRGVEGTTAVDGPAAGEETSRIGERGHLDVDELVKFIQGPTKSARGKNSLRGKRRTGAKR